MTNTFFSWILFTSPPVLSFFFGRTLGKISQISLDVEMTKTILIIDLAGTTGLEPATLGFVPLRTVCEMAGLPGFEPGLTVLETAVLPLTP